jgi:rhamnosyltransferase subunit B
VSTSGRKSLHVLLPTLGSSGDVHPFIGLGLALRSRGHRATLITNPFFQSTIEQQGLDFVPIGSVQDVESALADPDLWHARRGFEVVAKRVILPALEPMYRIIEAHADASTVVAASSISLGARIAQDKLGIPTASVHLQPTVIRSHIDQGMFGDMRISASQPMWFKRALFRFIDWAAIDRLLERPLNDLRRTLALPPVHRVLHRWVHSPDCVIGFFPDWFAAPQADWPAHTHLVGFPLWDGGGGSLALPSEAQEFLAAGDAPVVVTPGSAASTAQRFFAESVAALRRLGARAMLVTNFHAQLPRDLPVGVRPFGYLPFSELLPRAALLVHHGGIGTSAQTIKAGIPHLVVPRSHDQFDNGWRLERLELGVSLPERRYRAPAAARALRTLLDDTTRRGRCLEYAAKVDSAGALARACELIEALAARRSGPGG